MKIHEEVNKLETELQEVRGEIRYVIEFLESITRYLKNCLPKEDR